MKLIEMSAAKYIHTHTKLINKNLHNLMSVQVTFFTQMHCGAKLMKIFHFAEDSRFQNCRRGIVNLFFLCAFSLLQSFKMDGNQCETVCGKIGSRLNVKSNNV